MKNLKYCLVLLFLSACASNLEPLKHRNTPIAAKKKIDNTQFVEQKLDTDHINFVNLEDGSSINLGEYLAQNKLDMLLLFFGSENCTACNAKNKELRDEFAGRTDFQFIGVNTDDENSRQEVVQYRTRNKYDFIKWSDPQGSEMLKDFQPEGTFGVPLSALVNKDGIIWRYTNKEKVDAGKIIERAYKTMADIAKAKGIKAPKLPKVPDISATKPSDNVATNASGSQYTGTLWSSGPQRFSDVKITDSQGKAFVTPSAQKKIFQINKGGCSDTCSSNEKIIANQCKAPDCVFVNLLTDSSSPAKDANSYYGGSEFLQVFSSVFDWRHQIIYDEKTGLTSLGEATGPFVLTFDANNKLSDACEGASAAKFTSSCPMTPNYQLYSPDLGKFAFGSTLSKTKFTVLNFFGKSCGSCRDSLAHWSAPGSLLDMIQKKGGQIFAVETTPLPDGATLDSFYQKVKGGPNGLDSIGNRIPVVLDASPMGANDNPVARFYKGYISARYPDWDGLFGTIIYDQEGKIIAGFKDDPDEGVDKVLTYVSNNL